MMLFKVVITIIEAFILSSFIVTVLELETRKKLIIYLAIMLACEIMFFNFAYLNNFLLFIVILISVVLFIWFVTKRIKFVYFLTVIFGYVLIIISDVSALFIVSNLLNLQLTDMSHNAVFYITAVTLSKVINVILCVLSVDLLKRRNNSLSISNWWLFLVFFSIVILIIAVIMESVIYSHITPFVLEFIVIGLVALCIIAVLIYLKIDRDNKIKMDMQKTLIMNEYMNKNYSKMNYLHNRTIEERHRMIYLMMKIKNYLEQKDYMQIGSILDEEIEKLNKFQIVSTTSNPYFDFKMNEVVNHLKDEGFDITLVCELHKEDVLLQEEVVSDIVNSIQFLANYADDQKKMTIFINNMEMYLTVKISTYSNKINDMQQIKLKSQQIKKNKLDSIDNIINLKLLVSKEIRP